jgi:predicted Zn-ribbon and HTH transcriptional regulator
MKTFESRPVTIATFDKPSDAAAFRQFLAVEDIPSIAEDERLIQRLLLLSSPKAGIHIKVSPAMVMRAEACLAKWETPSRKAVRCPRCKSSRVEYPQLPRNFILSSLFEHLAMLLGFEKRSYRCKHCETLWRRSSRNSASKDEHLRHTNSPA